MGIEWRLWTDDQIERLLWEALAGACYSRAALDQGTELVAEKLGTAKGWGKRTLSVGGSHGATKHVSKSRA
jgi:hypothetical protein